MAQRLLEITDLPIELIAAQAGFGSSLALRQLFGEVLHTSPSAYRREFRGQPSGGLGPQAEREEAGTGNRVVAHSRG